MEEATAAAWAPRLQALEELARQWRNAGVEVFQRGAAETDALRVAANAELVASGRRDVSGKTRDFAKLEPEAKLKELGTLVKAYQAHVDDVTRALKHAESAHRNVHGFLRQLVDPFPALDKFLRHKPALLAALRTAEGASELRAALRDREAELAELKNQEVTIRQLREEVAELELQLAAHQQHSRGGVEDSATHGGDHAAGAAASESESAAVAAEAERAIRQLQEREAAAQQEVQQLTQECRRQQLLVADLKEELAESADELRVSRLQLDRAADEAAAEILELRTQLGVAKHEAARAQEQMHAALESAQRAPSKTPAKSQAPERSKSPPPAPVDADAAERIRQLSAEIKQLTAARDAAQLQATEIQAALQAANGQLESERARAQASTTALEAQLAKRGDELGGLRSEVASLRSRLAEKEAREAELRATIVDLQVDLAAAEKRTQQQQVTAASAASSPADPSGCNNNNANGTGTGSPAFDLGTIMVPVDGPSTTASDAVAPPLATSSTTTSESESVAALLAQRESLRRRIRALEDVGLSEVRSMRSQLEAAQAENKELLAQLNGATVDPLAADEAAQPAPRHAPSLFGLAQQSAVDRAASVVSHLVLSSRQSRRAFAAYQLILHTLLVLFLAYYIL